MPTRIIEIFLKLGLDKAKINEAEREIKDFDAHLEKLERRGGSIRTEFARTWKAWQKGAISAEEATRRLEDQMEALESHDDKVRNFSGYFGDIAATAAIAGGIIAGPLLASIGQFVTNAGMADETSRDWLDATKDLERSQQRIGRVAAQVVLPVLEKVAEFAEMAAGFAEEHPGAVKAALGIGGGLLGIAAIAEATEKGIRIVADVRSLVASGQQLLAAKIMERAANQQLAAAGGMQRGGLAGTAGKAAAIGGTAVVAGAASLGINEMYKGIAASAFEGFEDLLGMQEEELGGFYGWTKKLNTEYGVGIFQAKGLWDTLTGAFGATEEATQKVEELTEAAEGLANSPAAGQVLEEYIAFQQEQQRAEGQYLKNRQAIITSYNEQVNEQTGQYQKQRLDMVEEFEEARAEKEAEFQDRRAEAIEGFIDDGADREKDFQKRRQDVISDGTKAALDAEKDYKKSVGKFLADSAKSEQAAEEDYYDKRKDAAKDFNVESQRAEEDHQKNLLRMRQDHNQRITDAVRSQDASAFLREEQSYELNRRRSEEDFQDSAGQEKDDFKRRMAEMEEEFQAQREERAVQREEQLAEMRASYEEQKAERVAQQEERLAEMDAENEASKVERLADFQERLAEMDTEHQEQLAKEQAQHQERLAEADLQHQEEKARMQLAKQDQLSALDTAHQEEKALREQAFADQVRALDAALLGEQEKRNEYYELMAEDLEKWLKNMRGRVGSNLPGGEEASKPVPRLPASGARQSGGYVNRGLYAMHPNEYVLSAGTTRAAETALGGPLSQAAMLSALGGGGRGASVNSTINNNFASRDDQQVIMAKMSAMVDAKLLRLERGY